MSAKVEENLTTLESKETAHLDHLSDITSTSTTDEEYIIDEYYTETWKSKVWQNFDYPAPQRRTLFKLDFCVLFCAMFSTFVKYIDKANLSAAYVSGMKEDLGVKGNELSYASTGYSIFGIIFGTISGFIMVQFNTKWYMIAIECLWTLFTFCFAFVKTPTQMVVMRTLIGIESAHFSILMVYIGSYYKKTETARRCNLINAFTAIGPMCAFALQAQCVSSLEGVNGFRAWQWLFFVDTIFSVGCVLVQVVFLPNILEKAQSSWIFSEEELSFLRHRLPPRNLDANAKKFRAITKQDLKNFSLDWRVYYCWLCSAFSGFGQDPAQAIPFYFKGWNSIKKGSYTTHQINVLTIPAYALQLVVCFAGGWISDGLFAGRTWQFNALGSCWVTAVCFYLATHKIFEVARPTMIFFMYNTCFAQGLSGQFWAEAQELFATDTKLRAFVSAGMNPATLIRSAIFGPIIYPSSKLPETYSGYYTSGGVTIAYVIMLLGYGIYRTVMERRAKKNQESEKEFENDSTIEN
uniref:MFS transporter n=1 Tax=Cyberlindnera americana TaxID=36016 RepID=A0A5P8N8B9_9ASCO|nr:MFS transporter [Cyberlindnera americana]